MTAAVAVDVKVVVVLDDAVVVVPDVVVADPDDATLELAASPALPPPPPHAIKLSANALAATYFKIDIKPQSVQKKLAKV
jgi:hypothetical protein